MAEQTHSWDDRTLPQDPWADQPTPPMAYQPGPEQYPAGPYSGEQVPGAQPGGVQPAPPSSFSRGRAAVNPAMPRTEPFTATHEPTGTGWPGAEQPRPSIGAQLRQLRRGGEWSSAAVLFAFVCWGIWTISTSGDFVTAALIFTLTLLVAVGLFALSRLLGRVVLEKQLHRVRRTARGAHMVAGVFMVGVGLAHLKQTPWVMTFWGWITGLFG
jgi:hypothetical protein